MKLVVPYIGEVQDADARLIRLAEFLGGRCELLFLAKDARQQAEFIERVVPDQNSCLVINPRVMREWLGGDVLPAELVSSLVLRFPYVLMHGLRLDPFVADMVATLSGGKLQSIQPIADAGQPYEISSSSKDICGPFAGLSFGIVNAANDRVFAVGSEDPSVRQLIRIGGRPHMAAVKRDNTEILFLASEDIVDINAYVDCEPMCDYFSRLVTYVMVLRYIFGEECWRPCNPQASIIIDDPVLRREYGYLHFESLLCLMQQYNFHTAISFIPLNYRRNSARIIRMFRENPQRLSICFHGNDHTKAEFASTDTAFLNAMLGTAEERMNVHEQVNGLHCDRVMVFPQDDYSVESLQVLKSRNFRAAISRRYPVGESAPLTIVDLIQPAVLRYGGVPLFTRNFIKLIRSQDIAFNLFFGKPILVGEHHDAFKHPESLLELVQKINSIAPGISWRNLKTIVDNSSLKRRGPDGTVEVRTYSSNVLIVNDSASVKQYSIEWHQSRQGSSIEGVLRDGTPFPGMEIYNTGIRVFAELPPGASQVFSVVYRNECAALGRPGFVWDAQAHLRRRLSELRDNYLSKNQHVSTAAKAVQRRFLK